MKTTVAPAAAKANAEFSIRNHLLASLAIVSCLIFGVAGWAATANISGAVIAPGSVVVERNVKKVQHSYGGIVAEINVKNGDRVLAGDVLLRLDPTQPRAELGVLESQYIELTARTARLKAERDGANEIEWPSGLVTLSAAATPAITGETRLFQESRRVKAGQKDQLRMKLQQVREEIIGLNAQRDAKVEERAIVSKEVADLRNLFANKLTTATKLYALERDFRRIEGEHGNLIAQAARANAQLSEIELQILGIDENVIANAQRDLVVADAKLAELSERIVAARDKISRVEIRAPRSGVVHDSAVHTIGGVVTPAEQLMLIVPEDDRLTIQARIQPHEVDQVRIGRSARMRLTAFNQQTTPEVEGIVVHVSGDVTVDAKTGASHYMIRVELADDAREKLGHVKLVPGMPVEVYLATGDRTVLSYLAKPLTDQMSRAFRE